MYFFVLIGFSYDVYDMLLLHVDRGDSNDTKEILHKKMEIITRTE